MSKKYVKIPIEEYITLQKDSMELCYLESCGVDNWDPGISREEWREEYGYSEEIMESDFEHLVIDEESVNKDLISFGMYLLSEEREEKIKQQSFRSTSFDMAKRYVYDADISNWKETKK